MLVFIAPHVLSTGAVVGITLVVSTPLAFLLGALTASLVICLCCSPRSEVEQMEMETDVNAAYVASRKQEENLTYEPIPI